MFVKSTMNSYAGLALIVGPHSFGGEAVNLGAVKYSDTALADTASGHNFAALALQIEPRARQAK